jgi:outer membrane lipoprotein LolB
VIARFLFDASRLWLGASMMLLAACASVGPPAKGRATRNAELAALSHWRLDGRIAVQSSTEAFQAGLVWEHEGRQDRVQVSGPLSQGAYSIVLQDNLILVRDNSGNVRTSRNPAALLHQELGVAVPLVSLRYWVLGIADPGGAGPIPVYDDQGRLQQLRQADWVLSYLAFVPAANYELPQKLLAESRDIKLKLVVDDWAILR